MNTWLNLNENRNRKRTSKWWWWWEVSAMAVAKPHWWLYVPTVFAGTTWTQTGLRIEGAQSNASARHRYGRKSMFAMWTWRVPVKDTISLQVKSRRKIPLQSVTATLAAIAKPKSKIATPAVAVVAAATATAWLKCHPNWYGQLNLPFMMMVVTPRILAYVRHKCPPCGRAEKICHFYLAADPLQAKLSWWRWSMISCS